VDYACSGMGKSHDIVRGYIPIRPIVSSVSTTKTDIIPLTSGFSTTSGMSYSGFSGLDWLWYSPADSGTHQETWGPTSINGINHDIATIYGSLATSEIGSFNKTYASNGTQLIGGFQEVVRSTGNLSIDVTTIPDPPPTPPAIATYWGKNEGQVTNSGSGVGPWTICQFGIYDDMCKYILSGISFWCQAWSSPGWAVTMGGVSIELGNTAQSVVSSFPVSLSSTSTYNTAIGTSDLTIGSCLVIPAWAGDVQWIRVRMSWSCQYSELPTAQYVYCKAYVSKLSPVVAGFKVESQAAGSIPSSTLSSNVVGAHYNLTPLDLPSTPGYLRMVLPTATWTSDSYNNGSFGPPNNVYCTAPGQGIRIDDGFSVGNITEYGTSLFNTYPFPCGPSTVTNASVIEEFYHAPADDSKGNCLIEEINVTGTIGTTRTSGSSGFSSMKWVYDDRVEEEDPIYLTAHLYPPLGDCILD
jgi:hypothetical protein